ncbi:MAG: coproporphyrinogen dehydrogenase HemZ [Lachnospiraceae bacterium]|nr:coproporphyrinogen dehydrogenase HemZ [Lachnospiraceae bacterium]
MVKIILPERDFDYELQALVASFFPGHKVQVEVCSEEPDTGNGRENEEPLATINIKWSKYKISADFQAKSFLISRQSFVTGDGDWHKHIDKSAHPYRTYYKNVLKKLVFNLIKDFPEEMLPEGLVRRIPAWGTMTGVRPVKIVMDEILKGRDIKSIRENLDKIYCLDSEKAELALQVAKCEAGLLKKAGYENGYSLYIGIPFCPTTCLYCSFASNPYYKELADAYLEALFKEMEYSSQIFKDRKLASVYIGGGTPTALDALQLSKLLDAVHRYFPVDKSVEFTVEAGRPDSITEDKLKALRSYGTGRISVNPQTMQQKTLDIIGRRHTARQTADAFNLARKNGFNNINMDLITGLPGETAEDFKNTLSQISELCPDSLTIHSLVVKRASKLREKIQEDGTEDGSRVLYMEEMFNIGQQFAREQGYHPYYMYRQKNSAGCAGSTGQENIGYAKEGKECLYNILIMEEKQTILALGAGASTKLYHTGMGQVERIENVKNVNDYIGRIGEMIGRKKSIYDRLYKKNNGK